MAGRHIGIVSLFALANASLVVCSFQWGWDGGLFQAPGQHRENIPTSADIHHFETASFYLQRDEKPFLKLKADELQVLSNAVFSFVGPTGAVFTEEGEIHYVGKNGTFNRKEGYLRLANDVTATMKDRTFKSEFLRYFFDEDKVLASGGVETRSFFPKTADRIFVSSDSLVSFPKSRITTYSGQAQGLVKRKRAYEKGIEFESEKIRLDLGQGKVDLMGDVAVSKDSLRATALRGEIFLENFNKKLEYFVLYNGVKVVESVMARPPSTKKSFERTAFSEKLECFMSENRILLTGSPRVIQEGDTITGNTITLRENNETIEVQDANSSFRPR